MAYSKERKASVIWKMLPPHNTPLRQLSREEGISEGTLGRWRSEARAQSKLLPDGHTGPEGWSSRDKFAAVVETASLNEAELSAYCRERGLYPEQIRGWRDACERANDWERAATRQIAKETKEDKKRVRDLEKELARKEKALAETAALMVLRKKSRCDLGPTGGRGRMTSAQDRKEIVALIDEAVASGARQFKACAELGLHARTYQRWKSPDGEVREDRRPTAERPAPTNRLTEEERDVIVVTCNASEFASLPPSQIVPILADRGTYIGSESSLYRVLRERGQAQRRGRAKPPHRPKPPASFEAKGPCEVWSWDIPGCLARRLECSSTST